jgi:hypothetical protein
MVARLPYPRSSAQGIDIQWRNRRIAAQCSNARRTATQISLKIRAKKAAASQWPSDRWTGRREVVQLRTLLFSC